MKSLKNDTNVQNKNRLTDIENKLMVDIVNKLLLTTGER